MWIFDKRPINESRFNKIFVLVFLGELKMSFLNINYTLHPYKFIQTTPHPILEVFTRESRKLSVFYGHSYTRTFLHYFIIS